MQIQAHTHDIKGHNIITWFTMTSQWDDDWKRREYLKDGFYGPTKRKRLNEERMTVRSLYAQPPVFSTSTPMSIVDTPLIDNVSDWDYPLNLFVVQPPVDFSIKPVAAMSHPEHIGRTMTFEKPSVSTADEDFARMVDRLKQFGRDAVDKSAVFKMSKKMPPMSHEVFGLSSSDLKPSEALELFKDNKESFIAYAAIRRAQLSGAAGNPNKPVDVVTNDTVTDTISVRDALAKMASGAKYVLDVDNLQLKLDGVPMAPPISDQGRKDLDKATTGKEKETSRRNLNNDFRAVDDNQSTTPPKIIGPDTGSNSSSSLSNKSLPPSTAKQPARDRTPRPATGRSMTDMIRRAASRVLPGTPRLTPPLPLKPGASFHENRVGGPARATRGNNTDARGPEFSSIPKKKKSKK